MIWLLASRWEPGGLERVQLNLLRGFRERGETARVIAGRDLGGPGHAGEVDFVAPRGAWQLLLRLPWLIRRARPAIVVTTANDLAIWIVFWQRLLYPGTAVVIAQHLALSAPRKKARGSARCKREVIGWLMRFATPAAQAVVAVSEALARDMEEELGLPVAQVRVIHNPITRKACSAPILPDQAWPFPDDGIPVFIYAGRLSPEKRLDLLWEAFVLLRQTHRARLLVLGQGKEGGGLAGWAAASALQDDVALPGRVEDVLPWMVRSTALVLCSDYEGFGNVLVEAMHCGIQVVATDCPHGPAEVLGEGRYGQLVPVGDAAALAQALRNVVEGNGHVPAQTLRARADAFSIETACQAYLDVFSAARSRLPARD